MADEPESPTPERGASGGYHAPAARLVISMTTRKIHRQDCRYVEHAGSASTPFADATAVAVFPHCGTCRP